jgi:hypothetical protein
VSKNFKNKRPYKMPPPSPFDGKGLVGPQIESFTVGSWCPTQDGTGPATAVAITLEVAGLGDLVMRIKSPMELDRIVQMLLRHKRDVWPEAS